jgi:predicted transcriptional regulator YdeE
MHKRVVSILATAVFAGYGIPAEGEKTMPEIRELPGFAVIGLSARTSTQQEISGKDGKIGPLWQAFMHGGGDRIPGVVDPATIYSVYTNYESDETGAYDVILGRSVSDAAKAPAGLRGIMIPKARYVVFRAKARSPEDMQAAWAAAYKYFAEHHEHRRAFSADFDRHSGNSAELFIAIR